VKDNFNEEIKYFIKTHISGLQSSNSTAVADVDPRELFVYKLL